MKILIFCCFLAFFASTSALKCFPVVKDPKPACGANEEYSDCGAHGCLNTCAEPALITYCDPAPGCYPGCVCKAGFLKDSEGNCVEESACPFIEPICAKAFESYNQCGTACPKTCENKDKIIMCTRQCVPGCYCGNGYVRDASGECIKEEDCPVQPICAKAFEEYNTCGTACPATCENKDDFTRICTANCVEGCFCQEGYIRDASGECILPTNCPAPEPLNCKENEYYVECSTLCGEATCDRRNHLFCGVGCQQRCLCNKGYVRNSDNICIKEEECPIQPVCTKAFEEYTDCGTACPNTCENKDDETRFCTMQCVEGCFCQAGYVRDASGDCVLPTNCPAPEPIKCVETANEHYEECSQLCDDLTCEAREPTFCRRKCMPRCMCDEGYVRNEGVCIPVEKCPVQQICSENEEYSECGANGCQNTCENPTLGQVCRGMCMAGCVCKEGFLRDNEGNCVEENACPAIQPICAKAFEEYTQCNAHPSCQPTCGNPEGPFKCPRICQSGCICQKGYVKDKDGNCVLPEDCPGTQPVCGEDEEYSECGANACENSCALLTSEVACRPSCAAGCICKEGLARDSEGNCVDESSCFEVEPNCRAFQHYEDCGSACPITCENRDNPPLFCTANCVVGCFCDEGYVFDSNKNCVKPTDCPKAVPAICNQPLVTGPCKASFKRWGYNTESGSCTEFNYGGCEGNSNRYDSEDECVAACL